MIDEKLNIISEEVNTQEELINDIISVLSTKAVPSQSNQKSLGKVLIFGDSLSSGFNESNSTNAPESNIPRWSDYLTNAEEVRNFAVGGTTWGTGYSVSSSVSNQSCEDMISSHSSDISWADTIIVSYGGNDVRSCINGNTTYDVPIQKAIACINSIKNANSNARIIYVYPNIHSIESDNNTIDVQQSTLIDAITWVMHRMHVEIVHMLYGSCLTQDDLQGSGEHFNAIGARKVGKQLNMILCEHSVYVPSNFLNLYCETTQNPLKYNYDFVAQMIDKGMTPYVLFESESGVTISAYLAFINRNTGYQFVSWNAQVHLGNNKFTRLEIRLNKSSGMVFNMLSEV